MSKSTLAAGYPRQLRVIESTYWPHHRDGWRIALRAIADHLQAPDGIAFISYVDGCILDNTVVKEPWVGFLHGAVHFSETDRLLVGRDCGLEALLATESWQRLAPLCQGIFTLSTPTRKFIAGREAIPVASLLHPAETVDRVFTFDKFLANPEQKLLHVGWWGRRVQSLYDLVAPRYQKVWLRGTPGDYSRVPLITNPTVRVLERVGNEEYDRLLEANVVFLDFQDTAANNTVVECIVRHTPLLVRKLDAVVEYLGDDYPLYYDSLDEAAAKLQDVDLIRETTHYLRNSPIQEKLTPDYFLRSLVHSAIYQQLVRADVSAPQRAARVERPAVPLGPARKPRLLFCSYHCYGDPSSGAALCTRDLLEILTARGWKCGVFCGPHLDFEDGASLESLLAAQQLPFERRPATLGSVPFALVHYEQSGIPVTVYDLPNTRPYQFPTRVEGQIFLSLFERILEKVRPDVLLTYGGYWLAEGVMARARQRGIPVVFFLLNCAYQDARMFRPVDAVLVLSRFAQAYYQRTLRLPCTVIPCPLNWSRIRCPETQGRYVTLVNPQPDKGVYFFVRIAHELGRRRPDIPLLVVEGRGQAAWLQRTGLDLRGLTNLHVMGNTPDPRDYYRVSRLVLMPSLWQETFGRVAAEALINGIPVLASRRGALPEVLDQAGFLFDVPACYTPESRTVPSVAEVAPWVDTLIRLWDDTALYEHESQRCRAAAEVWRPERTGAHIEELLAQILR